jgi:hypothetical protein
MYPTNAPSLLCKTLHRFANMFQSRGIIIRAPHTLNIGMLLYTIHIRSYTACGCVTSVLFVVSQSLATIQPGCTRGTRMIHHIYKIIYSLHTIHL